ncbi:transcriptional regulator TACO1-like protein [Geopyxis carbonaria]|nr:transcriptional regulator TACO1-like protein [Geopyxis carbonaria]
MSALRALRPFGRRLLPPLRPFTTTASTASGHSRWSKIKHDKGKVDARRGASFSKLSADISAASRDGGPIPGSTNLRLTAAIAAAKRGGLPKDKIAIAIQRGQGRSSSGAALEPVTLEAVGPGGVALLVEGAADNRLRMLQEVRVLLARAGAREGPAAYCFDRVGVVRVAGVGVEAVLEAALEWEGVEDIEEAEGEGEEGAEAVVVAVRTSLAALAEVERRCGGIEGATVVGARIEMVPKEETAVAVPTEGKVADDLEALVEKLEEYPDVGEVWTNAKAVDPEV